MLNIAVFVSGGGTNFGAIINAKKNGGIKNGNLALCVASNADAFAITRAKNAGIPSKIIGRKDYAAAADFDTAILSLLAEYKIDLIVLAGYMTILSPTIINAYPKKIINVHPSLIPSFCGDGFYGLKVHRAALDKGVKVTGATVHFVNEIADGGEIILQKAVEVLKDDTETTLQKRVMEQAEWICLPQAIEMICDNK